MTLGPEDLGGGGLPGRGPGDLRWQSPGGLGPGGSGAGPRRRPPLTWRPRWCLRCRRRGHSPCRAAASPPPAGASPGGWPGAWQRPCPPEGLWTGGWSEAPAGGGFPGRPSPDLSPPASWSGWLSGLRAPSTWLLPIGLSWAQPAHGGAHSEPGHVQSRLGSRPANPSRPCPAAPRQPPPAHVGRLLPAQACPAAWAHRAV